MKESEQSRTLQDNVIDSRRLITGLRHALDVNYARVLAQARTRWERSFEGRDPSDACVKVRINSGTPRAGVLKRPVGSLLYGNPPGFPA
jgi:hypothetical protein